MTDNPEVILTRRDFVEKRPDHQCFRCGHGPISHDPKTKACLFSAGTYYHSHAMTWGSWFSIMTFCELEP